MTTTVGTAQGVPDDVEQIRKGISAALRLKVGKKKVGDAKYGVYAFYDYDGEPIYVGQTTEMMRVRIQRHLTNQRTDAVAMKVLDPFEVAEIEMWPFFGPIANPKEMLDRAEFTVFQKVLAQSSFNAVLNEKDISEKEIITLPPSIRVSIIPPDLYVLRKHPDVRIARRASTIAALARIISERDVSRGLRQTLLTQAKRLERLARIRFDELD